VLLESNTSNFAPGLPVPTPTFPPAVTVNKEFPLESLILKRLATCPTIPLIVITAELILVERAEIRVFRKGVVVPKEDEFTPFT
jgi:hypothetical protein